MKKESTTKKYLVVFSVFFLCLSFSLALSIFTVKSIFPDNTQAASLINASATLSNPRLSYRAGANSGIAGTSTVTIDSSGNSDNTTHHLFPGDSVCFTNGTLDGCIEDTAYTVASTVSDQNFNISTPLVANVDSNGYVVASQSGNLTITFTTVSTVPIGGSLLVTIPMADSAKGNDGIPDSADSTAHGGFDLNALTTSGITVTGCTDANWDVAGATISPGSGTTDHTVTIPRITGNCAASSTITVTINNLVNPSPYIGRSTEGVADVYKIQVATRDGSTNPLDTTNLGVAPIEGVLVSATIDQSLSFTVAAVTSGQSGSTYCDTTTSVSSNAYSIPWGTIATANTFLDAAQTLTVSTNASSGYTVKISENDQMGLNGATCTGNTPDADGFTFGSSKCIRDTICDSGDCTEAVTGEWNTATVNGFGYSLASVSGTPAVFYYGESSRSFSSRQIADQQFAETQQNIMANSVPVSGDSARICYRLSISGTQPAGYYYNKVLYTATATF